MRLDLLTQPVDGIAETLDPTTGFDHALVGGLLRPQPESMAALHALADAVGGTPLAAPVAEAVDKAEAGAAGEDHFAALAAARMALFGAVHDALLARVDEATNRKRAPWPDPPHDDPHAPNLRAAASSWLADLARAGWRGLTHDLAAGSAPVLVASLPDLRLRRLAALLDGFTAELAASAPGAELDRVPERRWADLWSRAMLLARPNATDQLAVETVTGRLLPLGVDLHEHSAAAQAQVHAVLEPADGSQRRLVRASVSVAKPDTIVGAGVWQLLRPHLALLGALGKGRAMDIADMPLTAGGDLLWQSGKATLSTPAAPFATARVALAEALAPPVDPLDRHPVRIAEPVFLERYNPEEVPFTLDRLPAASPLTLGLVAKSTACIGLIRWDAGTFTVQPLALETTAKKKTVAVQASDSAGPKAEKAADEAVAALRERAGRLLRK
jgi:hypothetical protein